MSLLPGRLLLCALFLLLAGAAGGCGKKTPPVPPNTVLPAAISDLQGVVDEKGVTLSWSYPRRTVRGERLPYRIEGFYLSRAVIPPGEECPGCPIPFGPPVEIKGAPEEGGRMVYREALLRPGHRYVYQVRSRAGLLVVSEGSNTVSLLWDTPLMAPADFRIEAGDRQLALRWQPPPALLDGSPVEGPLRYQLYRSLDGESFAPLGGLLDALEHVDSGVRNERTYHYQVRGVRLLDGSPAAGLPSAVLAATPRDLVPPAAPGHVAVVPTETGVRVLWEAVSDADLAGYRIYRRSAAMPGAVLIGEVGAASLSYVDAALPAGPEIWRYSVTAFDRARPANESAASMEVVYEKE
jgi:uncharacterized protein